MSSDLAVSLAETTNRLLNDPQAALLNGVLFGSQTAKLPQDFVQALKITGMMHVVAVSGQNLSILAGFVAKFGQLFGGRISLAVQALGIIGYVFLVGGTASVIRSGIMALIVLFAVATRRQKDAGRALVLAVVGMVVVHPDFLIDIGWQLSVLATAGIIWLEPVLSYRLSFIPEKIRPIVSISLAAQAMTWPVILYYFGTFSLIALPVNILAVWSVPWSMALGALAVLTAQIWFYLGLVSAWLAWVPLTYFVTLVDLAAKIPLASFQILGFPIGLAIIYYAFVSWWALQWWQVKKR